MDKKCANCEKAANFKLESGQDEFHNYAIALFPDDSDPHLCAKCCGILNEEMEKKRETTKEEDAQAKVNVSPSDRPSCSHGQGNSNSPLDAATVCIDQSSSSSSHSPLAVADQSSTSFPHSESARHGNLNSPSPHYGTVYITPTTTSNSIELPSHVRPVAPSSTSSDSSSNVSFVQSPAGQEQTNSPLSHQGPSDESSR